MIPCRTVSDELWDWLIDGPAHPLDAQLSEHLAGCPACRALREQTIPLRAALKGNALAAPTGFEESLRARLTAGAASDPRFEPDPELEDSPAPVPTARLVDRRSPAWWRPLALVASGAAAVLVLGLGSRWMGPSEVAQPGAASVAQAPQAAAPASDSLAQAVPGDKDRTGLLAERPYEEGDSSSTDERRTDRRERLTPVTTTP